MRRLSRFSIATFGLGLQFGLAQQQASIEATLKALSAALDGSGRVSWVQTTTNTATNETAAGVEVSSTLSEVNVDAKVCVLTFRQERNFSNYRIAFTWKVPFIDIGEVEVVSLADYANKSSAAAGRRASVLRTDTSVVLVQINAAEQKKFAAHRWSVNSENQVIENDVAISPATVIVNGNAAAKRVAAGLLAARESCVSAGQEPRHR